MKMWKKLITSILSAVVLCALFIGNVYAAETTALDAPYTYTVTFYPGNNGTFDEGKAPTVVSNGNVSVQVSKDKIVVSGLEYGDQVGLNAQSSVVLSADSKYYAKGIRLSGRDNGSVANSVFAVTGDADYVVAYGIKGAMTSYSVRYQDAQGNTLLVEDVFYGNVGDKPVVAYKYVEGYTPQVIGFTKTLSENEADNVFTFVYSQVPTTAGTTQTPGQNVNDNANDTQTEVEDVVNEGTTETPTDDGAPEGPVEGNNPGENQVEIMEDPDGDGIVDLDDEEVPLANIDADKNAEVSKGISLTGIAAISAIALVGIANGIYFIRKLLQRK